MGSVFFRVLPDAGCFPMHSQHLGVCISLDAVGAVHILVCFLAVCTFSGAMSVFALICVYVCL